MGKHVSKTSRNGELKSFKGEVVVPYERGFTNYWSKWISKSNCGDAIQFVLGYKSAKDVRASNVPISYLTEEK